MKERLCKMNRSAEKVEERRMLQVVGLCVRDLMAACFSFDSFTASLVESF